MRGPKGVSCFIEFADIPTAMAVHDAQQGAILASSDRGGIRIQVGACVRRVAAAHAACAAAPPCSSRAAGLPAVPAAPQYSKNPFGRKRDAAGAFVQADVPGGGGFPVPVPLGGGGGPGGAPQAAVDMQQGSMGQAGRHTPQQAAVPS